MSKGRNVVPEGTQKVFLVRQARRAPLGARGKERGKGKNNLAGALAALAAERQAIAYRLDGATKRDYNALHLAISRERKAGKPLPYKVESNALGVFLIPAQGAQETRVLSAQGIETPRKRETAQETRERLAARIRQEWRAILRGDIRVYRRPSHAHIATHGAAWHGRQYARRLALLLGTADRAAQDIDRVAMARSRFDNLANVAIGKPLEDISFGALVSCLLETPYILRFGIADRAADFAAVCKAATGQTGAEYMLDRKERAPRVYTDVIRQTAPGSLYSRQVGKARPKFAPDVERRAAFLETLDRERAEHARKLAAFFDRHGGRQEV